MGAHNGKTLMSTGLTLAALASLVATPVMAATVQSVDPDTAIDGDLAAPRGAPAYPAPASTPVEGPVYNPNAAPAYVPDPSAPATPSAAADGSATYRKDDLIGAAEGVFGKGARGLATMIEDILAKQGEPNGYIVGREGGGALIVGLRYGSGTLMHKVEGERPVYWTGPSVGFDAGANAGNAFVLVYNLHDSEELYNRFPAGEGQAYMVGGFNVSYMRRGDVVLIPVRMGAGLRLGANFCYIKF